MSTVVSHRAASLFASPRLASLRSTLLTVCMHTLPFHGGDLPCTNILSK